MAWYNPATWAIVDTLQGQNNNTGQTLSSSLSGAYGGTSPSYNGGSASTSTTSPYTFTTDIPEYVAAPQPTGNDGGSGGTGYSGGSGSGGTSEPAYNPIDMLLIDAQIKAAQGGLGRIGDQRTTGLGNISKSFNDANTKRQNQFNAAQGKYDLTKTRNEQDYSNIRSGVRRDAGQQYTALQRLLGSAGAGRSSAAQILTPFAVGRQAAQRFGQTEDQFGRNMQDLDTSWQSTVAADAQAKRDLEDERANRESELRAGLLQSQLGFEDTLNNLRLQKTRLQGGGIDDVRSIINPYQSKIADLLSKIDGYGDLKVTATPNVKFNAPSLQDYQYSRFEAPTLQGGGVDPRADYTSPFVTLLRDKEDERLKVE